MHKPIDWHKTSIIAIFYLIYLFTLPPIVLSQQKKVIINKLNTNNGLPSNLVTDMVQDSNGYIWIGTADGLCRFDGTEVKQYRNNPTDSSTISNNAIRSLLIDRNNKLWISTNAGLSRYLPKTDNFRNFAHHKEPWFIRAEPTGILVPDKTGNIWIGQTASRNIYLFDPKEERVVFKIDPGPKSKIFENNASVDIRMVDRKNRLWLITNNIFKCIAYNQDSLWVQYKIDGKITGSAHPFRPSFAYEAPDSSIYLAANGLFRLHENKKSQVSLEQLQIFDNARPNHDIDYEINHIASDHRGRLLISTSNYGLLIYDPKTGNRQQFNASNSPLSNYVELTQTDQYGNAWVFSDDVLWLLYSNGNTKTFLHSDDDPDGISDIHVGDNRKTKLFIDRSGTHWLNTGRSGTNYFNLKNARFTLFAQDANNNSLFMSDRVWGIIEDHQGRIWMGGNGLKMYNPATGKMKHFSKQTSPDLNYLEGEIMAICEVSPNNYFVSTQGRVAWYTYTNGQLKVKRYFLPEEDNSNSLVEWSPRFISRISTGEIWMGRDGLSCYRMPEKKSSKGIFTNYRYTGDVSNSVPDNDIWGVFEAPSGRLWFYGNTRLFYMDKSHGQFITIVPKIGNESIENLRVRCMAQGVDSLLWIATDGNGLISYHQKTGVFRKYSTRNGLPANNLFSVFTASGNSLWMSSNKGLIHFYPETGQSELFTRADGLQSNEFIAGSFYRGRSSGKIFIGGNEGMNAFHPKNIDISTFNPNIVFTTFVLHNKTINPGQTINNRIILDKAINWQKEIILKHNQNFFSIEFAALDFSAPEKILYQYMLEDIDKSWNSVDAQHAIAKYTSIPPGQYTFKVKSTNGDRKWMNNARNLKITVLPPWWQTWWAYSTYALLVIIILYIAHSIVTKQSALKKAYELEKIERQKNKEVEEIKTRFFLNISHELQTPLTLILGPAEKLLLNIYDEKTTLNHKLIHRNANRLLRLINQLLDFRKLENKQLKLNLSHGDIIKFVEDICEEFRNLAEQHSIQYQLSIFECHMDNIFFDPDKLEKILYNLLSNAFKYTPDNGKIAVVVRTHDRAFLQITISDTGSGISSDDLPYIFDRFYRARNNATHKQTGSGIGLALTKELAELHGGNIFAQSKEGEGSVFSVDIPLDLKPYTRNNENIQTTTESLLNLSSNQIDFLNPNNQPSSSTANNNGLPALLIVDDNEDIRTFISSEMKDVYIIFEAKNGKEGIEMAIENLPDLIISDVMMPVLDGIELCKSIKSNELTSHIPVILLTAKSSEQSQLQGLHTGADDYILKPFSIEVVKLKVQNTLLTLARLKDRYRNDENMQLPEIAKNKTEHSFIEKLESVMDKNLQNSEFNTDRLAIEVGVSKTQLYNKLKGLTGQSTAEFIKFYRLKMAVAILKSNQYSVKETAYMVGFVNPKHFSKVFKIQFGKSPSEYIK